jgi:DNA repair exonuclease SbcCD ATPase subunit
MVMIIVGVILIQFISATTTPMVKEYDELLKKIKKILPQIKNIDEKIDGIEFESGDEQRLKETEEELEELKYQKQMAIQAVQNAEEKRNGKIATLETVDDLADRLHHLERELERLKERTQNRREALTGSTLMLTKSSGSGKGYRASFIECSGNKIILHPDKTRIITKNKLDSSDFKSYLKRINGEKRVAVFLIREDGVKIFDEARIIAKKYCDKIGFLPLPGDGPIDFRTYEENR